MRSSCVNCGQPKAMSQWADPYCEACTTLNNEAQQHYAAEHPDAPRSDVLYAGRVAMGQRTIRPGSNYVDPRAFSASRRALPTPPKPGA